MVWFAVIGLVVAIIFTAGMAGSCGLESRRRDYL